MKARDFSVVPAPPGEIPAAAREMGARRVHVNRRRPCFLCSKSLQQVRLASKGGPLWFAISIPVDGHEQLFHVDCARAWATEDEFEIAIRSESITGEFVGEERT